MAQELTYEVSIKTERIEASDLIDPKAIDSLVELNRDIEAYRDILKKANEAVKEGNELTEEQQVLVERVKGRLKETSQEYQRQQRELVKMNAGGKELGNTYNDLVKRNSALSAEMRATPLDDTSGKLEKLRAEYVKNNDELKKFDSAMGNNQRNVGNYQSALDGLGGALKSIPGPIGDIAKMFEMLTKTFGAVTTAVAGKTTVVQGFTAAETGATVATAAQTTATVAQTAAVGASTAAIGFETAATNTNTAATIGNASAQTANAAALGGKAAASATATATTGSLTIAQRALNTVMKANPVLLLVAALAGLYSMLSSLQPVMNNVERLGRALGTAFDYARDTVYYFINGIEDLRPSLLETIRIVDQATVKLQQLADTQGAFIEQQAKDRLYIAMRRRDAQDETKAINERIQSQELALIRNRESAKAEQERARIELKAAQDILAATESSNAQKVEAGRLAEQSYATLERLANQEKRLNNELKALRSEANRPFEEAAKERDRIEKESAARYQAYLRSRNAALTSYREHQLNELDKLAQEIRKSDEQYINALPELPSLELDDSRDQAILANAERLGQELAAQEIANAIRTGDQLKVLDLQQAEDIRQQKLFYLSLGYSDTEAAQMALTDMTISHAQERADAELAIQRAMIDQQVQNITNLGNTITGIGTAMFGKSKAIAVAQAIIDTYAAANSALKSTPGGPLAKGLAVAAVIAKGLANVRTIMSTNIGSTGGGGSSSATMAAPIAREVSLSAFDVLSNRMSAPNASEAGVVMGRNGSDQRSITVDANVDRRGLAIAVREGEMEIRTAEFTYS